MNNNLEQSEYRITFAVRNRINSRQQYSSPKNTIPIRCTTGYNPRLHFWMCLRTEFFRNKSKYCG